MSIMTLTHVVATERVEAALKWCLLCKLLKLEFCSACRETRICRLALLSVINCRVWGKASPSGWVVTTCVQTVACLKEKGEIDGLCCTFRTEILAF